VATLAEVVAAVNKLSELHPYHMGGAFFLEERVASFLSA
jgi:hypothetical protein